MFSSSITDISSTLLGNNSCKELEAWESREQKGVGQNRVQLLVKVLNRTQQEFFFLCFLLKTICVCVQATGKDRGVVCGVDIIWLVCSFSLAVEPDFQADRKPFFLVKHECAGQKLSAGACHTNKHSHCLFPLSNGSRDKPEPGPHALCHRVRFLWQPKNKRHVLCML